MSAEAYRDEEIYREADPDVISIKRNPYLVDYEHQRRLREHREPGMYQSQRGRGSAQTVRRSYQKTPRRVQESTWEQEVEGRESRRMPQRGRREAQCESGMRRAPQAAVRGRQEAQRESGMQRAPQGAARGRQETQRVQRMRNASRRANPSETAGRRSIDLYSDNALPQAQRKRAVREKRRAAAQRRRIARMQRMVLFSGIFCIALLCGILYMDRMDTKAEVPDNKDTQQNIVDNALPAASSFGVIQGLPAAEFAKHPEWEEKLLTPNEYSRPGDALEEVNNIFVHYTANPNTSAAQNRSYFEQLKDTHITSASAHFIVGYNGEIIQCIPLDEIAYAVQTRNYDSISIECCYKAADGSFTQETYDSLIELLAWLTDVYDLTTDDIMRHYDCGGKKCPIYYTEHEDAWERLKKDVGEKL